MSDDLKSVLKEFVIDMYLEFNSDEVLDTVRRLLAPITAEAIKKFVGDRGAPPVPRFVAEKLRGYEDYLERIRPEELFEWLVKARPDLAEALASLGDPAAEYMVSLKGYIVDSVKALAAEDAVEPRSEGDEAGENDKTPSALITLRCDVCGESWTASPEDAEATASCPFCGQA